MPRFDPADWGGDPIPLSKPRDYNPMAEVSRLLALASTQQIDQAVLAALQRRGLSLADAIPRLTRQVHGPRCTVLLDGQPLVEFDPPKIARTANGRHISVTVTSREANP